MAEPGPPVRVRRGLLILLSASLALGTACHRDDDSDATSQEAWDGSFATPPARPEHPRPDFFRDTFINLNTRWEFAYDPQNVGVAEGWASRDDVWTDTIQLPYAWDAPASGLTEKPEVYSPTHTADATTYRGVAWYRLALPGPLPPGDDWYLVFGAVDDHATVFVDGQEVATHEGGYAPFSLDLTAATLGPEPPVIVVRVEDQTELSGRVQPVGKQGGAWYTRTSGIWQTVYLEQRPPVHIEELVIVTDPATGTVTVLPSFEGEGEVTVRASLRAEDMGRATAEGTAGPIDLPLSTVEPWDVDTPTLYDLEVTLTTDSGVDVVHSYFGLAHPSTAWMPARGPGDGVAARQQAKSFTFNDHPVYLRCVLDQSYWPDGVYTAPSLEAIRADLQRARDFGFNCIRLHVKADEPVKLRLIDELGFYLVYDIPSLDLRAVNTPQFEGRRLFEHTLDEVIRRDRNHPSLMLWVVFNENWGLFTDTSLLNPKSLADAPEVRAWVQQMVEHTRALDPTRPIEDNSPGGILGSYEHLTGESNSFHHYEEGAAAWREFLEDQADATFPGSPANYVGGAAQDGDPWWNSEFGTFSFLGGSDDWPCLLWGALNELRRTPRLAGWTLTQLTDVEFETNGLVTYDRTDRDLCSNHGVALPDLLQDAFVGFDWLPGEELVAGASVDVPVWFSAWAADEGRPLRVELRWDDAPVTATSMFTPSAREVSPIPDVTVQSPSAPGEHILVLEVFDADRRLCANRLAVSVQ